MAFVCQLIEGSEPAINLFYLANDGWSMLDKGLIPNDPERRQIWGGQLENMLVREEYGKRTIPLRLYVEQASPDALIDAVNAFQKRLEHAARYRMEGWGDEVFLRFQLHNATYPVDFPVSSGSINKAELLSVCSSLMTASHRVTDKMASVGVTLECGEPNWEATATYTLNNMVDNPAFWRGALPGDSWTEVDPAAALTLAWNTSIWERMGRALQWTIAPDAVNDVGIRSDNITVVASTQYYVEYRGYHTTGCDDITARVYDVSNGAVIAASVQVFNNGDNAWEKLGVAFTTPVGCVLVRIEVFRLSGDSSAGNKTFYCDAFYLDQRGTAPIGWSSGRNLVNHLDGDADDINVLCVAEIPGEVDAEIKMTIDLDDTTGYLRCAKRTRDDPHNFIWELNACDAYTESETGAPPCTPGLLDAALDDSDKTADATSPCACRITVDFAGNQAMADRCYWDITSNLTSYYGQFVLWVIAKVTATVDTVKMAIKVVEDPNQITGQKEVVIDATAGWRLFDGWEIFSFRIGTHDDDLFGAGNNLRIYLRAEIAGAAAWDNLHIACAYLASIDEELPFVAGGSGVFPATTDMIVKDMDGDRGFFAYGAVSATYYANLGAVGGYPLLSPEVENWLYFVTEGWVFNDSFHVSLEYRPRGIFLRGTDPG